MMPDSLPPSDTVPEPGGDVPLDGIAPTSAHPAVEQVSLPPLPQELELRARSLKRFLILAVSLFYTMYVLWCGALLLLLPSAAPGSSTLVSVGVLSSTVAGLVFLLAFLGAFLRVGSSKASIAARRVGVLRAAVIMVPGLLLSVIVPLKISQPPPLSMDITYPTSAEDFVAPLSMSFSVEKAVVLLREQGLRPVRFVWDFEGDGKPNDETVLPVTTALYSRSGVFTVSVRIDVDGGEPRTIARRLIIPTAVFSVSPERPILEQDVAFSVAHLLSDAKQLQEVVWDFGDGSSTTTTRATDVTHTFYITGRFKVSAIVRLANNSQRTLLRTIEVMEPPPLPFPVTMTSTPSVLIGPAPFGAVFTISTVEPIREISWSFGDGKGDRGPDATRISHAYDRPGIYPVIAKIRSMSGSLAELSMIVRATEKLSLSDLRFKSEPEVKNNVIEGEVPLTVSITPTTLQPLIDFSWDTGDASAASITGATVQAIYRKEGTYALTLIARDPDVRTLRQVITINAKPPTPSVSISLKPDTGVAPLRVLFDASDSYIPPGSNVIGYEWDFGDVQNKTELGLAQTEHVYVKDGQYTVTLNILTDDGEKYSAQRKLVVRLPPLSACITASRLRLAAGGAVEFRSSECSTGLPTSVLWDIRNVSTSAASLAQSDQSSFVHVFDQPGTYAVSLTLQDQFGNKNSSTVSVTVTP